MQARGFTVLAGAVAVLLLSMGMAVAPVPYVVLQPGPTWDTLGDGVIEIEGTEVSEATGELHLTTVSVQPDPSLFEAIGAWFSPDQAVVPEELVYPPDQSREEVDQRNREQFARSQSSAETAALRHLGYPVAVTVLGVVADTPADGRLAAGDVITAVDGVPIAETSELAPILTGRPVGTTFTIDYRRGEVAGAAEITTAALGGDDTPRIGVEIADVADPPFSLSIELDRIGGPSAGLMFALGIIDTLDPDDLTGGEVIAGTGTIDGNGTVGPIGGVSQKLVAADGLGAAAFLVPAGNCAEAVASVPAGLTLVRVDTLDDALAGLAAVRNGQPPTGC